MLACAALTNEDLPMPRAPQSRALLAGRPLAKRSVFSIRMSRIRSMPFNRKRSTRLTRLTSLNRPFGCQTKASALPKDPAAAGGGALADKSGAIASSARAMRAGASLSKAVVEAVVGLFAATRAAFCTAGRDNERDAVLRVFFDMSQVPDGAALSGLAGSSKRPQIMGGRAL